MSDKNDSKRAKMSQPDDPVVVSEEDIALLNELNMLELLAFCVGGLGDLQGELRGPGSIHGPMGQDEHPTKP